MRKYGQIKKEMESLKVLEIPNVANVGKDGHRQMMKIRLIKSRKSWIWNQHL